MKKTIISLLLSGLILSTSPTQAGPYSDQAYDGSFVPVDLILFRPLGLAATVVGAGVFVALSPLTAFAQIARPHDAFHRAANVFIVAPAQYTFHRPLGVKTEIYLPEH